MINIMKRIITIVFALIIILWILSKTGCFNKFDINNTIEVKKYLMSNNFQHFEYKGNMTSFLQFNESKVTLSIYLDGKELTAKSYYYKIGLEEKDYRIIEISENEGNWKIKSDGSIYMWNKGELYTYQPFGDKKK